MKIVVHGVAPHSPAASRGFVPGDEILQVNGRADLEDLLDYQFEVSGTEYLEFRVRRTTGTEEILTVEKAEDEDVGLAFTSPIFTPIKTCNNACPFCFIDQQPEGLRASLYVKDDDYRLSYFNNTYITLTNLTPRDVARIERLRPGPLYVSVHCTVPEIRQQLLVNKKAGEILQKLRWLQGLEIPFHCQVVVCPGINDGEALSQTLADLATLRPEALSVAVVPVGLTQYRDHLPSLKPVDEASAHEVIRRVAAFEAQQGTGFVFLSDEFYYKAGLPIPNEYGDFPQLDDGVGTARVLLDDFHQRATQLPERVDPALNTLILTGKLAAMSLQPIVTRLNEIQGFYVDLIGLESRFWGKTEAVAGLITGHDIITGLAGVDLTGYQWGVIPSVMLKQGTDLFLDGQTVAEVSQALGLELQVVEDPYSAGELLQRLGIHI